MARLSASDFSLADLRTAEAFICSMTALLAEVASMASFSEQEEIVAPVTVGDLDDIAAMSELDYIFLQNDFHCSFSDSMWRSAGRTREAPAKLEARGEGEQGDVARLLDGQAETALVTGADPGEAAGNDLAALCDEALKETDVAVGDSVDLLCAELADLLAAEELATAGAATGSSGGTWGARTTGAAGTRCGGSLLLSGLRAGDFVSHCVFPSRGTLCLRPAPDTRWSL